jgi:hypothetical protein
MDPTDLSPPPIDEPWEYLSPPKGQAQVMARELLDLAGRLYGPEQARWMVTTNSDDGLTFGVPAALADRYFNTPTHQASGLFDPEFSSVAQVKAHLQTADDAERLRVIEAERAGKGRKSILDRLDA